jgi:hypothetical protein
MPRAALLFLLVLPSAVAACKCELTLSACRETATSEVIFIGTVESIEPNFLDQWNPSQAAFMALINREFEQSNFPELRDAYLKIFPDLPADYKKRLHTAATKQDLSKLFYRIIDHGKRVRLRVKTLYRNGDDKADDDEATPKTLDVWTAFGECGFHFQTGETYLVYADADEESGTIDTGICSRTRRLSDAGDDLAYLYYWKNFGAAAARLEGFVTSDFLYLRDRDAAHYTDRIGAPMPGLVIQLKGADRTRYTETGEHGRYVFDGLTEGAYTVTGFAPGYPTIKKELTTAREVRVPKNACVTDVLVANPGR